MRRIPLARLSALAGDDTRCTRRLHFDGVDFSRAFVHESLTPLYYTAVYQDLSFRARLRYNQLAAMKVNEQFVLLEDILIRVLLPALLRHPATSQPPMLRSCLRQMQAEEQGHLQMFLELNRLCLPEVYGSSAFYFMRDDPVLRCLFRLCGRFPRHLSFGLWFLLLIEEYTVGFSRRMMHGDRTETLGELDQAFRALHGEHIKDEVRHTHIDAHLLQVLSPAKESLLNKANIKMLARCIRGIFVPADTITVLRRLVEELPELSTMKRAMEEAVLGLASNEAYQRSLFSRTHTPLTFSFFDETPGFQLLHQVMPAYVARG